MRVPVSRMDAVRAFLESGTPSGNAGLSAVRAVVSRWRALVDAVPGRARQPRWARVAELLGELDTALKG